MSDLAPYVAAALRDKVVDDLLDENRKLREQLDNARKVEITGKDGSPVYATGAFQDGTRRNFCELWDVPLEMVTLAGSEVVIPISALKEIEICLGGVVYASSSSSEVDINTEDNGWDGKNRKEDTQTHIKLKMVHHIHIPHPHLYFIMHKDLDCNDKDCAYYQKMISICICMTRQHIFSSLTPCFSVQEWRRECYLKSWFATSPRRRKSIATGKNS